MAELGRGIDPFEVDLLGGSPAGLGVESLAQGHDTLLDTGDGTFEEDEVVLDLTVVDEATQAGFVSLHAKKLFFLDENLRSDLLLGDVEFRSGVALVVALANTENLVVARGTVVVTHLTGTSNSPLDVVRVPGTDTSNLTQTLVSLTGQLGSTPTGGDTLVTVTLGNSNDVDHLVLLEDAVDLDGLLEQVAGEVDLVADRATVDLDLHQVRLLLLERRLADLGVGEHTHDRAVLLDALKLAGDGGTAVLGVLLGVLGEGLLLALVPVLVEPALDLVAQVLGPHSGERAETTGSLDVADNTDSDKLLIQLSVSSSSVFVYRETYRRSLDNGSSLDNLLLVHLGTGSVKVTDDSGHTGLVAHGGRQVDGLLGVILGEAVRGRKKNLSTTIPKFRHTPTPTHINMSRTALTS